MTGDSVKSQNFQNKLYQYIIIISIWNILFNLI